MHHSSTHRLIRALYRQPVDRTPVWLMRQAGRYLPEYRAIRAKIGDFLTLCKTPTLASEITIQPLKRFDLDAAIIFSDILVLPEALGMRLSFVEGKGPQFHEPLVEASDLDRLKNVNSPEALSYVMEAIVLTKQALGNRVPLIGFAGSPWTLATYMIEGGSSRDFATIKRWLYQTPSTLHRLLARLSHALVDYLRAQARAGADVLMLFDTWGGVLAYDAYEPFSLHYMQQIIQALRLDPLTEHMPIILFSKNTSQHLLAQAQTGCTAIGLDWTASLSAARALVGDRVALQGNLDPTILYAQPKQITAAVLKLLKEFGHGPGHIFNLGHGVLPTVDPAHVQAMIDAVHQQSIVV